MTTQNGMKGLLVNSITEPCGLLCCAFGVKTSAAKIYLELRDTPMTVEELAEKVGKERSVVQRYLQELSNPDLKPSLVLRDTISLDRGGYYHVYRRNSSEEIRKKMLSQLDQWYRETRKYLLETWPEPAQK
ncbi:MAG: hypothetical protein ACFFDR_07790 [Candidatus Thorarchaeota archaeon]